MTHRLTSFTRFVTGYVSANIQGALEYRVSFFTQIFAMLINDSIWLIFWLAYFSTFPLVAGWGRNEVVMVWAVAASGFGLATVIGGNLHRLSGMIVRGELDVYMALPRPVLTHALISRIDLTSIGDILFGALAFGLIVQPTWAQWLIFGTVTLTTAAIFTGFGIVTQSLTFWLGNAEGLAGQLSNALLSFSTYPTIIFNGAVRIMLFSIIPAGFVAYVPVQLLRSFSLPLLISLLLFSSTLLAIAGLVFRAGLSRYESGNLVLMRD